MDAISINDLIGLCEKIIATDKTPEYGYGCTEHDRDNNNNLPPTGARWATPTEICRGLLRELRKQEEDA